MYDLILVRHGRSEWNEKNLFTGWYDCPLIEKGREEARAAAPMLVEAGLLPDVVHTSLQQRAIETAEIVLAGIDRRWIPVRRSWRLNERHYGDLTGLDKAATREQHGDEQLHVWRRSYDTPPPPIRDDNEYNPNTDAAYAQLPPELVPLTECLKDVVERMLPYWYDGLVPDLRAGRTVLVAAHGNSLRALVKHLDGISDADIPELNIPTGMPLHYRLGDDMAPLEAKHPLERALDPDAAAAGAAEVAAQATR
jgi:2,3-bisphosphoglycerate-dependent phosphoglycerate mutase